MNIRLLGRLGKDAASVANWGPWSIPIGSAARHGEMAALRVQDLGLVSRRLTLRQNAVTVAGKVVVSTPKSHNRRSVPVPAFLVEQIARHCDGKDRDDIVFPRRWAATCGPRTGSGDGSPAPGRPPGCRG